MHYQRRRGHCTKSPAKCAQLAADPLQPRHCRHPLHHRRHHRLRRSPPLPTALLRLPRLRPDPAATTAPHRLLLLLAPGTTRLQLREEVTESEGHTTTRRRRTRTTQALRRLTRSCLTSPFTFTARRPLAPLPLLP
ncbi:hypothetical protein LINPERPRIM_LOCUS17712 [Linum perenne]